MLKDLKILITDDDQDDREFISEAFANKGFGASIHQFQDGLQLLNFLKSTQDVSSCLVLLDLNMPIKDGYETLKEIKEDNRLQHIPVIILTTSSARADQSLCKTLGCDGYLIKPLSFNAYEKIADDILLQFQEKL